MFIKHIYSIAMIALTVAIVGICSEMAYTYVTENAGLHPGVATIVSALAIIGCIVGIYFFNPELDYENELADEA